MEKFEEKISIIVPIYNVEKYLKRCVESLILQTYKNIEILLVDDGSKDSSGSIADDFSKMDKRVITLHKENGGLSDARNYGLNASTGEYILYVDSDDYIEKDSCEKLMAKMQPDVDFVAGGYKEIQDKIVTEKRHSNIVEGNKYTSREFTILSIKKNEWFAPAWLNLYRKDFLLKNALFFKKGRLFEDHQMLPRLFLAANTIVYVDYPFYNYIIRENSIMTSQNKREKAEMSLSNYKEWIELFEHVNDKQYQKMLYGIAIRYYLTSCRSLQVTGWNIQNMDFKFALRYALDIKERVKILVFNFFPRLFFRI